MPLKNMFLEQAEGDPEKARELRSEYFRRAAPAGAHAECSHDSTKAGRAACRKAARKAASHD